jgi:hypothetical protein
MKMEYCGREKRDGNYSLKDTISLKSGKNYKGQVYTILTKTILLEEKKKLSRATQIYSPTK